MIWAIKWIFGKKVSARIEFSEDDLMDSTQSVGYPGKGKSSLVFLGELWSDGNVEAQSLLTSDLGLMDVHDLLKERNESILQLKYSQRIIPIEIPLKKNKKPKIFPIIFPKLSGMVQSLSSDGAMGSLLALSPQHQISHLRRSAAPVALALINIHGSSSTPERDNDPSHPIPTFPQEKQEDEFLLFSGSCSDMAWWDSQVGTSEAVNPQPKDFMGWR